MAKKLAHDTERNLIVVCRDAEEIWKANDRLTE
jgi:hypothetical protein